MNLQTPKQMEDMIELMKGVGQIPKPIAEIILDLMKLHGYDEDRNWKDMTAEELMKKVYDQADKDSEAFEDAGRHTLSNVFARVRKEVRGILEHL